MNISIKKKPKSKPKKDNYHHYDLKSSLVFEALLFLKKNSIDELSLRELARRLDVSHMAPYRHFKTKEDLFAEIIERGFNSLTQAFEKAKAQAKTEFHAAFTALGKAYILFFMQNPEQSRLMFSGLVCDPNQYKSAHDAGQKAFGKLLELIIWGQEIGQINKTDNPYLLSLMVWSSVHGSAMLMLENQFSMIDNSPEIQLEKYVDFMSEKLLQGMKF